MSGVQRIIQKVAVRSVAAELDRRNARLEQAIADQRAHFTDQNAQLSARIDALRPEIDSLHSIRGPLNASIDRLGARIEALSVRIGATDDLQRLHGAEFDKIRFELAAAQRSLADLTSTLERLTLPG